MFGKLRAVIWVVNSGGGGGYFFFWSPVIDMCYVLRRLRILQRGSVVVSLIEVTSLEWYRKR